MALWDQRAVQGVYRAFLPLTLFCMCDAGRTLGGVATVAGEKHFAREQCLVGGGALPHELLTCRE